MAHVDTQEVDAIMAELGLNDPPRPSTSGPGARATSGPGAQGMSGPGARGMSGPGARGMSGPGPRMSGPGAAKAGPGPGFSGPGAAWARRKQEEESKPIQMAQNTPDGRQIIYKGPPCARCGEMIIGQCLSALGQTYHPEHFVCVFCSQPFPDGNFMIHEDQPYCEEDYHELFSPRCKICGDPIRDKAINAGDMHFHSNHFCCHACGKMLKGQKYNIMEDTKEVYCPPCYGKRIIRIDPLAKICHYCKKPIIGEYLLLQGQYVHPEHYRCAECGCNFTGGNCQEYEGNLYCTEHYLQLIKDTCAKCHKPIVGRSVTGLGKVWHPEHFVCHTCSKPFMGSTYFEKDGYAYCDEHFQILFGEPCVRCGKAVAVGGINFIGKMYHSEHFMCTSCDKLLTKSDVFEWEGKPNCKTCYMKLPLALRKKLEKKRKLELKAEKKRSKAEQKERNKKYANE
eukprot:TRINITY_DN4502_c0_g1_i1.p1 TRINITY_DN4502_c0_g1~~TRINITY_DN4502_c0_g1_i1.p1  ORF type:complete len:453 (-),score=71.42 TRINITY_DN4502_c0_g1_i1:43-1401(-)